nr:chemotaxis protein CheW [Pseudomonas viridiflava]
MNLIFSAGFSTAEVVTDLSGRGVGMDVVKNAIDKLSGLVELSSEIGRGTTLRLTLPLSMAISSVMIVEADQQIFGVPMDGEVETVRINTKDIHSIKDKKTVILRDRIVPLVSLHSLLSLTAEPLVNEEGELAVLVIKVNHEVVGLLVDVFSEVVDVILKPMPGELEKIDCYSGSALLGDGSILMVLNPKELFS